MAFDWSKGWMVLLTSQGEEWDFDGTQWIARGSTDIPRSLARRVLLSDSKSKRLLLLGCTSSGHGQQLAVASLVEGKWQWMGSRLPVPNVSQLYAAFNPRRSSIVVLGQSHVRNKWGYFSSEFDGSKWSTIRVVPDVDATPVQGLAYDPSRGVVIGYGFGANCDCPGIETWECAGSTWERSSIPGGPSPRAGATLATHERRGSVVLFGGNTTGCSFGSDSGETWEVQDGRWWRVADGLPTPRSGALLAYDGRSERLVLAGGVRSETDEECEPNVGSLLERCVNSALAGESSHRLFDMWGW